MLEHNKLRVEGAVCGKNADCIAFRKITRIMANFPGVAVLEGWSLSLGRRVHRKSRGIERKDERLIVDGVG